MYIYTTPRFDQQAKQFGIQGQIAELVVAIQTQGSSAVHAYFNWNYPYLKRPVRNLRLLGKIFPFKNERVLCLLDVLTRGGNEYESFLQNPEDYGKKHLDPLVYYTDLENSIKGQKERQKGPLRPKFLPEIYHGWLQRPTWTRNTDDRIICEGEVWIKQFQQQETRDQWQSYGEIVLAIVEGQEEKQDTPWPNLYLTRKPDSSNYVLYSHLETADGLPRRVVFLVASFDSPPQPGDIEAVLQQTRLLTLDFPQGIFSTPITFDILSRYTRRAYPDYLVLDPALWLELEADNGINLALSVEEERILHELSSPDSENSLPLFINGRAGSGKSTMLVYLFAEYCDRYRKIYAQTLPEKVIKPLFLTYNERLLTRAKQGVEKLLITNYKFMLNSSNLEKMPPLEPCFQSFQDFLINLLPPEESDKFDRDRYISFYDFRQHCTHRQKRYSPELCWHIIRTFIKGYSLVTQNDEYMTPEDYDDVPRREKTISSEVFDAIYRQVWPWYYKLTHDGGYWDDQDLIRRVLQVQGDNLPKYTAIFCDEAQDFTKLELLLIVKLSLFSDSVMYPPIPSLPFAFAGDPFQTLNPTGFRWQSVKATFFDQVISHLDPDQKLNLGMSFYELESNYRSSPAIVKMTNLIHLWRHLVFKIPQLKPQEAWQPIANARHPQKFIFGQRNFSVNDLKRHIEKSPIFIVPCEAHGELKYIKNDEFLSSLYPLASETNPPKNVLSAIQAKGLEFPLVILYKFGEQFAKEFGRSLWDYINLDQEHPLELEYFFNKLYVAASRGITNLIVIDTEAGDRLLWQYATTDSLHQSTYQLEQCLAASDDRQIWYGYIGGLNWGDSLENLDLDHRELQAQEFEENGRMQKDPVSLRRAKQFYLELGKEQEALLCEAWALRFDRRFREAGLLFYRRGENDAAWECFWHGLCWQALLDWYHQFPESRPAERPLVQFMATPTKTLAVVFAFTLFLEEVLAQKSTTDPGKVSLSNYVGSNASTQYSSGRPHLGSRTPDHNRKPWKAAISEYASRIKRLMAEKRLSPPVWQRFGDVLEALDEAKYDGLLDIAGECFYRAKNLRRAVRCWQRCGSTDRREYNIALADVLGFPEGLAYLERAGNSDRIIAEWERAGRPVTAQWLKYGECVRRALLAQNRYRDWVEYLMRSRQWSDAIAALEECSPSEIKSLQFELIRQLARSNLTPQQVRIARSRYMTLIDQVLSNSDWKTYLAVPEVGIVLERIGDLVRTLRFYEQFVQAENLHLKVFARQRWIVNKIKQQNYAANVDTRRAVAIQEEINRKASDWRIDLDALPTDLPPIDRLTVHKSQQAAINLVQGLPPGVQLNLSSSDGHAYSFRIDSIEVRVVKRDHLLKATITDLHTLNLLQIEVDSRGGRVCIGNMFVEADDGQRLLFQGPVTGCSGAIIYRQSPPLVQLKLPNHPDTIVF
ncbi:hypothetical protein [Limnospira fusiformis]|uniref:hypothetical protein n=1 Tax=Limnospira fusiformis TaxID=54297 RepID=UPI001448CE9E|nr:hypothetical protein HFV01_24405 [Limnospira fusiformis SAG 85.79]